MEAELTVLTVGTPETDATADHAGHFVYGEEFIIGKLNGWPRLAVKHVELASLTRPHEGCTHVLVVNGTGFLYKDEAVAREDFDAIVTGTDPVRLRNDL